MFADGAFAFMELLLLAAFIIGWFLSAKDEENAASRWGEKAGRFVAGKPKLVEPRTADRSKKKADRLRPFPDCGHEVSKKSPQYPQCGHPF